MESSIYTENDPSVREAVRRELAQYGNEPRNIGASEILRQTAVIEGVASEDSVAADQRWREIGIDYS